MSQFRRSEQSQRLPGWAWVGLLIALPIPALATRFGLLPGSVLVTTAVCSLSFPIRGGISLFDTIVLGSIFVVYLWMVAGGPGEEIELLGPAAWIGGLDRYKRRMLLIVLFGYSAALILLCADPFAHG